MKNKVELNWIHVDEAIQKAIDDNIVPSAQNGYLNGWVAMYCNSEPDFEPRVVQVHLRFIGADLSRPYWVDKDCKMVENSVWGARYFLPVDSFSPPKT